MLCLQHIYKQIFLDSTDMTYQRNIVFNNVVNISYWFVFTFCLNIELKCSLLKAMHVNFCMFQLFTYECNLTNYKNKPYVYTKNNNNL
jgi:hypothetical protein